MTLQDMGVAADALEATLFTSAPEIPQSNVTRRPVAAGGRFGGDAARTATERQEQEARASPPALSPSELLVLSLHPGPPPASNSPTGTFPAASSSSKSPANPMSALDAFVFNDHRCPHHHAFLL
ncbi:hypothetical protein NA57DRAFT_55150 [Rhizodiscina lignyota]|uniref:Uncharacterized protein n=1 Tax=Rhizodiscina lignyota TaxID=1504668 RepID=A0A9P4IMC7_9PEZI|nr:hypothetical protein NA57DRAFT_55150 [Rhizodiscina lignyota]